MFSILEEETPKDNVEIENTNQGENRKRSMDRKPPRSKKANSKNNSISNPTVKPKEDNKKEVNKGKLSEKSENFKENENSPSPTTENHLPQQLPSVEQIKDQGEITPSPIIGNPYPRQVAPFEPERDHSDICGCHECFTNMCKRENLTTKESWIQAINNFIKNRKFESTKLETHNKGCMCVNHLAHNKEKDVQYLEKFIERKVTASYGRPNSRNASSINHSNLTTLT